jgi:plasmid stability protein
VRTTVRLDDDLYRQVKVKAAQTGRPVGAVIEDAIRASLAQGTRPKAAVAPLPTFGGGGVMPGVDLTDEASLRDLLDEATPLDARR